VHFLTYVLMQMFGVLGVALATSLMYCISAGYLVFFSLRRLKQLTIERGEA